MDKGKFQDQGKVPLFYIDQLDDDRTLLYFNKSELLVDWNKNHVGKLPPSPKVIDLMESLSKYNPRKNGKFTEKHLLCATTRIT